MAVLFKHVLFLSAGIELINMFLNERSNSAHGSII